MAASRQASPRLIAIRRPLKAHQANISEPATRKRTAHIKAGGMVRTAIPIPRYVDPQNTYTSANANHTSALLGRGAG